MKIAIQAADLDASRIDGTRVYILNLLKHFGKLDPASEFLIYHKNNFNPELAPPDFSNYKIKQKPFPFAWTQTRFTFEIWKDKPDALWMPMHALPFLRRKNLKTIVTIHDLAFKYFPDHFPANDIRKLNSFTDFAIRNATKLIAISEATKKDILKFYPEVKEEKIKVIYHGFDPEVFDRPRDFEKEKEIKARLGIANPYILYIGAIQPRKNLITLIEAFEKIKIRAQKKLSSLKNLQLVLVGEKAWLSEGTIEKALKSSFAKEIIMPGKLKFGDLGHLARGAQVFAFPALYEGFGIPVLEAFAAGVPVVCAKNSSLPEVAGDAALYFENGAEELAEQLKNILKDESLRQELIARGKEQIKKFSWKKCARETLEYIKS